MSSCLTGNFWDCSCTSSTTKGCWHELLQVALPETNSNSPWNLIIWKHVFSWGPAYMLASADMCSICERRSFCYPRTTCLFHMLYVGKMFFKISKSTWGNISLWGSCNVRMSIVSYLSILLDVLYIYILIFQSKSWTKTSVCWGGAFKPGVLCLTPTCGNASNLRQISFQLSCNSSPSSAEVQLEMINPTRYFWQISSEVEVLGVDHFWYVYIDIHLDIYALSSHTCAYSSLLTCDCFTVFFFLGGGW